jgi:hypothetical protein
MPLMPLLPNPGTLEGQDDLFEAVKRKLEGDPDGVGAELVGNIGGDPAYNARVDLGGVAVWAAYSVRDGGVCVRGIDLRADGPRPPQTPFMPPPGTLEGQGHLFEVVKRRIESDSAAGDAELVDTIEEEQVFDGRVDLGGLAVWVVYAVRHGSVSVVGIDFRAGAYVRDGRGHRGRHGGLENNALPSIQPERWMRGFRAELKPHKEAIRATFRARLEKLVGWRGTEEESVALAEDLSREATECGVRFAYRKEGQVIPVSLAYRDRVFVVTADMKSAADGERSQGDAKPKRRSGYVTSSATWPPLEVVPRQAPAGTKRPSKKG